MMLYFTLRAPNPDRVRYFLQEKGTWSDTPKTELSIIKQEHRTPEYRRLSPLAQIPALDLGDGQVLTESRAICRFFEGVHPEPNLMGRDHREAAVIEMWDRRIELTYLMLIANWFRHSHPAMAELEKPQIAAWAEVNEARARKMCEFLDERLAASPYVTGDRFTIADITLFVAFGFGRALRFQPWEEHAALARWRNEIAARPGMA